MQSRLSCYQLKIVYYNYELLNASPMTTTKKEIKADNTNKKEKRIKAQPHSKPPNHKSKQQERKKGTEDLQNNQKTISKMAEASSYLAIITLNVNGLNYTIKNIEWLNGFEKRRSNYILTTGNSPHHSRQTETKNKRIEKDRPCKQKQKTSRNSIYLYQIIYPLTQKL